MIDTDYRGQDMDVVMNRLQRHGAILSMSAIALALIDSRSLGKKTRENYRGIMCIFSDITYGSQSTHIGYERLFW